ncbi:MAG: hypothetical protein AB1480_18120 [Nitrospirota bacterium]
MQRNIWTNIWTIRKKYLGSGCKPEPAIDGQSKAKDKDMERQIYGSIVDN